MSQRQRVYIFQITHPYLENFSSRTGLPLQRTTTSPRCPDVKSMERDIEGEGHYLMVNDPYPTEPLTERSLGETFSSIMDAISGIKKEHSPQSHSGDTTVAYRCASEAEEELEYWFGIVFLGPSFHRRVVGENYALVEQAVIFLRLSEKQLKDLDLQCESSGRLSEYLGMLSLCRFELMDLVTEDDYL